MSGSGSARYRRCTAANGAETKAAEVQPLGNVQVVPISDVKPYSRHPRKIPAKAIEQCAESIKTFGWQQPLVVGADMVPVAGHTRHQAARSPGLKMVPVVVADLTAVDAGVKVECRWRRPDPA
jgi:hypothetical protein